MNRELLVTSDGSHTLLLPDTDITFHSRFGAIEESEHVYIGAGLNPFLRTAVPVRVLEMGFGTGLNAFLTYLEAREEKVRIEYDGIEAFPLVKEEYRKLNYAWALRRPELGETFQMIHQAPWNKTIKVGQFFTLIKHQIKLEDFKSTKRFNVIFYDAFVPTYQPELWTIEIFDRMYELLEPGGVLVTYCAKGEVRRALEAVGFLVEKLPGPFGKREILRAVRSAEYE